MVATAIPSLLDQGDVATLCPPDATAFQQSIAAVLKGDVPALEQRLARAEQFTYERRTDSMLHSLGRHGLLPQEPAPPQAMPHHRVRRQLRVDWVAAQVGLLPVQAMNRLGWQRLSSRLLDAFLRRWPFSIPLLNVRASQTLAQGDHDKGRRLIEQIWHLDGEAELMHQLLFRRGSRPGDRGDQLAMFDALASSTVLPLHLSGYCRIVRTYLSLIHI